MSKYRYRCEAGSTSRALVRVDKFDFSRLGTLLRVKAYRFRSTRKSDGRSYSALHERVMVVGNNGTASFSDFCWGYGGEGPHGLRELLIKLGVSPEDAARLSFQSERGDHPGIDWSHNLLAA